MAIEEQRLQECLGRFVVDLGATVQAAIREVVTGAGSRRFRRVAETPFNLVFEARP